MAEYVYFLRPVGMDGPVKIGHSQSPERRLLAFLANAPWPLEIAATIEGPLALEGRFHARFLEQHSHHEWFHPSKALARTIEEIKAGTFDTRALPTPDHPRGILQAQRVRSTTSRLATRYSHIIGRMLFDRKVVVPEDVREAYARFTRSRHGCPPPRDPADAAVLEAFIAAHHRPTRKRAA